MSDWTITISASGGQTKFSPNPLNANVNDSVCWSNRTNETHDIAVDGVDFSGPIPPGNPCSSLVLQTAGTMSYKCTVPGHSESGTIKVVLLVLCLFLTGIASRPLEAQSSTPIDCSPIVGQSLQEIPQIERSGRFVRGTLVTAGTLLRVARVTPGVKKLSSGSLLKADGTVDNAKIICQQQWFRAYSKDAPRGSQDPAQATVLNPLPGPTIRGRVGDLVELTFLNLIDKTNFPKADIGATSST